MERIPRPTGDLIDWNEILLFLTQETRLWEHHDGDAIRELSLFGIPHSFVEGVWCFGRRVFGFQIAFGFKNILDLGKQMKIIQVFQNNYISVGRSSNIQEYL